MKGLFANASKLSAVAALSSFNSNSNHHHPHQNLNLGLPASSAPASPNVGSDARSPLKSLPFPSQRLLSV
ncbi:hypothetical protein AA313_de0208230 [Arthrobotrys entomopaga]|nr:hypothetical protein AA313_de0208230 [Arthrobotrys entomopaga]